MLQPRKQFINNRVIDNTYVPKPRILTKKDPKRTLSEAELNALSHQTAGEGDSYSTSYIKKADGIMNNVGILTPQQKLELTNYKKNLNPFESFYTLLPNAGRILGDGYSAADLPQDSKLRTQYAQGGDLTQFNEGGLHSQNPLGGVPIGNNNSVEQGETKQDNFVYSNRIFLDDNIVSQYNLPKSLVGKSVADATKFIDNKFKGRNDKISQSTKNLMLSKIAEAQESMKPQEPEMEQPQEGMESQIPEGMVDSNQMAWGGFENSVIGQGFGEDATADQKNNALGAGLGVAMTGLDLGNMVFGKSTQDTSGLAASAPVNTGGSIISGTSKGAAAGAAFGPWGAGIGALVGAGAGLLGANKAKKAALLNNSRYARNINDQFSDQYAFGGEIDGDTISINDPRKIRATTRQPINPNIDLVTGKYSKKNIQDITNASLKYGVNPYDAIAMSLQETKLGKDDENLGHILGGITPGNAANEFTKLLSDKIQAGKKLGRKTDEELLQMYNGTGVITRNTEVMKGQPKNKSMYGVPVPKEGINMGKTNLYGIQVKDLRDNVIKKNKDINSIVNDLKKNFNHFEGQPYSKVDPRTAEDPLAMRPGAYTNINPKMLVFGGKLTVPFNEYRKGGNLKVSPILPTLQSRVTTIDQLTPKSPITDQFKEDQYVTDLNNRTSMFTGKVPTDNTPPKAHLGKLFNDNAGNIARYAPIAANAYQLSQLKKPQAERLDRLGNRYKPEYVDMAQQQNIVNQELNNTNSVIQQSGASQGAARNAILGAQLNKTKALSNAYMNAEAQNRQQDAIAQQFNLGVDQTNLQQSNVEKDINARDQAAYRNEKSKYISAIGSDIGEVGKEEIYKKIAKTTTGYSWLGEYQKANPNATPEETKEAAKKAGVLTDSTTKKALGGYLLKNKGK